MFSDSTVELRRRDVGDTAHSSQLRWRRRGGDAFVLRGRVQRAVKWAMIGTVAEQTGSSWPPAGGSKPPRLPDQQQASLAWLSRAQMAEVDRVMTEDLGIHLIQMMEHAGRHLAVLARERFLADAPAGRSVVVLAGTGGNGGGGLVAARRLHAWGAEVHIVTTAAPQRYNAVLAAQLNIAERLGIAIAEQPPPGHHAIVIDALVGYSLVGELRGQVAVLAMPKVGLRAHGAHVGELYLADISVPPTVYEPVVGHAVASPFGAADLVRLR